MILRALAEAAHKRGSRYIAFGTRALALACGLDHSTIARRLRELAAEPDPFIALLEDERGVRGDLYELRIPQHVDVRTEIRDLPAGPAHALRPAFRELGPVAALVYEHLERGHTVPSGHVLADAIGVSPAAAADALRRLAAYGLAERDHATGWRVGPVDPALVADQVGATEQVRAQYLRYAAERAAWQALLGVLPLNVGQPDVTALSDSRPSVTDELDQVLQLLARELGAIGVERPSSSYAETYTPTYTATAGTVYADAPPGPAPPPYLTA